MNASPASITAVSTLLIVWVPFTRSLFVLPPMNDKLYIEMGDLNIGGLLSVTEKSIVHACGHEVVDFYRIDMVESLVYFLRKANQVLYPNFYRTIAREADIVLALLRFMEANGWLYFSVVYSDDDQYLAMMMHLERNMGQRCIERAFMVSYKTNMTTVVEQLHSGRFSPRVAVPLLNTYFCKAVANEVRRLGKDGELLWIGLDTWMNMMFNRETSMGSVGVSYTGIDFTDSSFVEYLAHLNFETKNPWFPAIMKHMKCSSIECYHDMLREKYHTNPLQTLLIKLAVYGLVRTLSEFMEEHCADTLSDKISCFNQQSSQFASFLKEIAIDSEMRDAYLYNNQGQVIFLQWNPNAENEMIGLMSYNLFEQTIRRINDLDVKPFRFPPEFFRSAGNCKPICSMTEYHFAVSHCCWICKKCADNELATESQDHCEQCPCFTGPPFLETRRHALKLSPIFTHAKTR